MKTGKARGANTCKKDGETNNFNGIGTNDDSDESWITTVLIDRTIFHQSSRAPAARSVPIPIPSVITASPHTRMTVFTLRRSAHCACNFVIVYAYPCGVHESYKSMTVFAPKVAKVMCSVAEGVEVTGTVE